MKPYVLFLLFLFSACSTKPHVVEQVDRNTLLNETTVHVVSHGRHTGFVFPARDLQARFPQLKERFGDMALFEVGWGDSGFYQAKEITTGLTLRAIFWPTGSVVHVVALPDNVEWYFSESEIQSFTLKPIDYTKLIQFIGDSFHKDKSGQLSQLKKGIYGNSQFYKGVGDYFLMNTCNKWTAKGLKSAGMDISPMFKLRASSIMNFLENRKNE